MSAARRLVEPLNTTRGAACALGLAILASATLVLWVTDGQTFVVDELYYYARAVPQDGGLTTFPDPFTPTYLLAPFYGHLALGIRLTYETVFATIGADYTVFVLLNVAGIASCAILLFVFARRRAGNLAALAPCVLLLFYGFAREQFLWPIDFNSAIALATGLGAVLCLEREDRRGDVLAFLLLCTSVALIEVGVAIAAGIAVTILLDRRYRRLWIVAVPAVLYVAWWLWATPRFGSGETDLAQIVHYPRTVFEGLAGVFGTLTGTNPVVPGSQGGEVTWFGRGLAVVALVALGARIRLGGLPRTFWVWLAALGSYWLLLTLGERAPYGSRYLLVGAVLVILLLADSLRAPLSGRAAALVWVLVAVALPANVSQLVRDHENDIFHHDAVVERTDFAMLELARDRVDPGYVVSADPRVVEAGGGLYLGIPAGAYLDAAAEHGPIAYTLPELREQPEDVRRIADAALVGALGLELERAAAPGPVASCRAGAAGATRLATAANYLRAAGGRPVHLGLRRFADAGPGVPIIGRLRTGVWAKLEIPTDAATEPWTLVSDGPVRVCSVSSPAPAS